MFKSVNKLIFKGYERKKGVGKTSGKVYDFGLVRFADPVSLEKMEFTTDDDYSGLKVGSEVQVTLVAVQFGYNTRVSVVEVK